MSSTFAKAAASYTSDEENLGWLGAAVPKSYEVGEEIENFWSSLMENFAPSPFHPCQGRISSIILEIL